jgi:hypothetical protein
MQLCYIRLQSGECHVAAYVDEKVVDLQAAELTAAGKPDPMFDNLASLLATGEQADDSRGLPRPRLQLQGTYHQ